MKTPEISASYSHALSNLLHLIKYHLKLTNPNEVLEVFTDMIENGLPQDLTPKALKDFFPALELFKYWMTVSAINTVQNKTINQPNGSDER